MLLAEVLRKQNLLRVQLNEIQVDINKINSSKNEDLNSGKDNIFKCFQFPMDSSEEVSAVENFLLEKSNYESAVSLICYECECDDYNYALNVVK